MVRLDHRPALHYSRAANNGRWTNLLSPADYFEDTNGTRYGQRRRVTFDDADTLQAKYLAVLRAGAGGVGMWTADATHRDSVDDTVVLAKSMWGAVHNATTSV